MSGAFATAVVGMTYAWLSESREFFSIMVTFPCLLGGVMAVFLPAKLSAGVVAGFLRFGKGLFAAIVLGFVYVIVLKVSARVLGGTLHDGGIDSFRRMMWKTGPLALGFASALFFPMFRWASGQVRITIEEPGA